ncbi:uncharacterized protein LOC131035111 [Cryptomeria japonica]|uniref:uncharacterized protein LOC131035111 n=1 Tax=Cryptomeria japonica TaxID=3369 RepID=UPI0027D9EE20|nr:uncharacterized protein LOC131035111 [Cryptomeria japonica]
MTVTPEDCYRILRIPVIGALLPYEKTEEDGTKALRRIFHDDHEDIDDQDNDVGEQEAGSDGDDPNAREGYKDGDDEDDGEEEEDEKDEEDESNAVPHHSRDDTIFLDPSSIPSRGVKNPIRGRDSSPHCPVPTVQRHYERREPSGS